MSATTAGIPHGDPTRVTLPELSIETTMREMDAHDFERLVADVWSCAGWESTAVVDATGGGADQGIDVVAEQLSPPALFPTTAHIQCKRYSTTLVGGPAIQQYSALDETPDVDLSIVVTTTGYTDQARELAEQLGVKIVTGSELARFMNRLGRADLIDKHTDHSIRPRDQDQDQDQDRDGEQRRGFLRRLVDRVRGRGRS